MTEETPKTSGVSEEIMAERNTYNSTAANLTWTYDLRDDSGLPVLQHPSTSSADLQVQGEARFRGVPIKIQLMGLSEYTLTLSHPTLIMEWSHFSLYQAERIKACP